MERVTRSNALIPLDVFEEDRAALAGGLAEVTDSAQSLLCLKLSVHVLMQ